MNNPECDWNQDTRLKDTMRQKKEQIPPSLFFSLILSLPSYILNITRSVVLVPDHPAVSARSSSAGSGCGSVP